ncbi:MAG TPA: GNAT family N-acetyltransferase [Caldimonas sp.]
MASSEAVALERLGRADVDAGVRLSDGARWNQTARDWAFFVDHGETIGVRDDAGELVASAAALPYDGGVGWVSMVLVDPCHRHRGIATRLLGASVEALRGAGRVPVLDATPAGAAVYRRSGFAPGFVFERWEGDTDCAGAGAGSANREGDARIAGVVEVADERAVDALLALDRSVWSIGRAPLLRDFLARPGTRAWLAADASGFAVVRVGRRAYQLGPIVASDAASALALANAALASVRGPVFIDMPAHALALADALAQRGFARQRPFVRMALGDAPALAASARVFAVAGPEFG